MEALKLLTVFGYVKPKAVYLHLIYEPRRGG